MPPIIALCGFGCAALLTPAKNSPREAQRCIAGNYLFGYHPHGIISLGFGLIFGTAAGGFPTAFPGVKVRCCAVVYIGTALPFDTTGWAAPGFRDRFALWRWLPAPQLREGFLFYSAGYLHLPQCAASCSVLSRCAPLPFVADPTARLLGATEPYVKSSLRSTLAAFGVDWIQSG